MTDDLDKSVFDGETEVISKDKTTKSQRLKIDKHQKPVQMKNMIYKIYLSWNSNMKMQFIPSVF